MEYSLASEAFPGCKLLDDSFTLRSICNRICGIKYVAIITAVPCIASGIMFTAMFWALVDGIGNNIIRILLKVVILAIAVFLELGIFSNAIVPWLQKKEMNRTDVKFSWLFIG